MLFRDKPVAIVKTLIQLLQNVNAADIQYLSTVVTQWAEKGDLDHAVIQQFWHLFIGQVNAADDDRLSALQFLVMVAHGRRTIIERNMNLVAEIVFSDKCLEDPRYLLIGCNMISKMEEQIDVESKDPCFRVSLEDIMWEHLVEKVVKIYQRKDPFCHAIIVASISLIYKVNMVHFWKEKKKLNKMVVFLTIIRIISQKLERSKIFLYFFY